MTLLNPGASGFGWGALPVHAAAIEAGAWSAPQPVTAFQLGKPKDGAEHCYPGQRPSGSFVVHDGFVLPVRPAGTASGWQVLSRESGGIPEDLDAWLARNNEQPLAHRLACLGYGSNLNPQQVAGFAKETAVVVLRALTVGLAAAYCNARRTDGQFPAGVLSSDPMRVESHGVVLIPSSRLDSLDGKEGQGRVYSRSVISGREVPVAAVLEDGSALVDRLPVYLQDAARPLALEGGTPVLFTDMRQQEFDDGTGRDETHDHGLLAEPLQYLPSLATEPLPFFAYGTLQPGQRFWPYVEEFIERHEPASIRGKVVDTGLGYPGLLLDHPGAATVEGTLLHPHPHAQRDVTQEMDRIEGHPSLYTRHLVRLDDGRLAWTYAWNG